MRFLHLGDLHIGKIVCGYNMIADQRHALEGLLDLMVKRQVDALVLAGDIYDKAIPSAEAVSLFDDFLTQVVDAGIVVLGVPGNHDSAERIAYAQGILAHQGVFFPPVYDGNIHSVDLERDGVATTFWLMPFLKPTTVHQHHPETPYDNDYTHAIRIALSTCELDPARTNILVAHQFVTNGGVDETERASDEINLGGIDNVDASAFDAYDYVALGHVHRAQRIRRDVVRYSGSLLKYSLSEVRYPKTAVLVDVEAKAQGAQPGSGVTFELVEVPVLHDVREVTGTLAQVLDGAWGTPDQHGDYLYVCLTDPTPQIDAMAKLQAAFPRVMALDYLYEREAARSAGELAELEVKDLEQLDPYQLFQKFFEQSAGRAMDDSQREAAQAALREAFGGMAFSERVEAGGMTFSESVEAGGVSMTNSVEAGGVAFRKGAGDIAMGGTAGAEANLEDVADADAMTGKGGERA